MFCGAADRLQPAGETPAPQIIIGRVLKEEFLSLRRFRQRRGSENAGGVEAVMFEAQLDRFQQIGADDGV